MITFTTSETDYKALYLAKEYFGSVVPALDKSPHYQEVFAILKKSLATLSQEGTEMSADTALRYLSQSKELLDEFCRRNINFYERNYDLISGVDANFHFARNQVEMLGEYVADPDKLLPEWCSPRKPDLVEMTERFTEDIYKADSKLARIEIIFNEYLQHCERTAQMPNDPINRLEHCLSTAIKECATTKACIHQFNWARHLRHIIDTYQHEAGYNFNPPEQLNKLMLRMTQAQDNFFKIKDFVHRLNGLDRPESKSGIKRDVSFRSHGAAGDEYPEHIQKKLENYVAALREDFYQGMGQLKDLTCKTIEAPVRAGFWNDDMKSSWFHEREKDLPSDYARAQAKAAATRPPAGNDNFSFRGRNSNGVAQDNFADDLLVAGLGAAVGFGLGSLGSDSGGMGGIGSDSGGMGGMGD